MHNLFLAALIATVAAGPGMVSASEKPIPAAAGQASSVPKEIPTAQYLEKAAAGDLFEVESGKLAMQKGGSEEVKEFGRMMTEDHTASTEKIKQAVAKSAGGKVPSAKLTSEQEAEMKRLMNAEKGQFDKLYIDSQVKAHQEALELHRSYAATGDDPALKQAAAGIVPVVEKHLTHLQKMSGAKAR
jgi:putative membrane protein